MAFYLFSIQCYILVCAHTLHTYAHTHMHTLVRFTYSTLLNNCDGKDVLTLSKLF